MKTTPNRIVFIILVSFIGLNAYIGDIWEQNYFISAQGLGNANTGLGYNNTGQYFNAGGLAFNAENNIIFSGNKIYNDINCYLLSSKYSIGNIGVLQISYSELSIRGIPITDYLRYNNPDNPEDQNNGTPLTYQGNEPLPMLDENNDIYITSTFQNKSRVLQLALSKIIFDNIGIGFNIKNYRYSFSGSGSPNTIINSKVNSKMGGFGFDLGILYRLNSMMNIGANYKNIGDISIKHEVQVATYQPVIKESLRIGTAFFLMNNNLTILADIETPISIDDLSIGYNVGFEYILMNKYIARCGIDNGNIAFGLGYIFPVDKYKFDLIIDYAFVQKVWGSTHNMGVKIRFR